MQERRIFEPVITFLYYITATMCLIMLFIAANNCDFYQATNREDVNYIRFFILAFFFLVAMILVYKIARYYNFDIQSGRYTYDHLPIVLHGSIVKEYDSNEMLRKEIDSCYRSFVCGYFGRISKNKQHVNRISLKHPKGRIMAKYTTSEGIITMETDYKRTMVKVEFLGEIFRRVE